MRSETFPTPEHVALDLRLTAGEIHVEALDVHETSVRLTPLRSDDATLAAIANATIESREHDGAREVVVHVPEGRSRLFGSSPEVRLDVRCPRGTDLRVTTVAADVDAMGGFGEVTVKATSADVTVDDVAGAFKSKTTSGDIDVAQVQGVVDVQSVSGDASIGVVEGPLTAQLISGGLRVRSASSSVNASTVSGDQELGSVREGSVSMRSVSGNIKVGIRRGSRLHVDARSLSGDTESEVELDGAPGDDEGPLVELRVNSVSGDVRVVRAAAEVEAEA
jgi:hypothetical protein